MTLFVSRCPYRISLLGGGSDLDWWLNDGNIGYTFGFAIKEAATVVLTKSHEDYGTINYSSREIYRGNIEISHPIIREALNLMEIDGLLEICSFGSSSSGGGLGGSSAFTNALLGALHELRGIKSTAQNIAALSSIIEIEKLGRPIGRQDNYISAYGGINIFKFEGSDASLIRLPSYISEACEVYLSDCILVHSKITRSAHKVLSVIQDDKLATSKNIEKIRDHALCLLESINEKDCFDVDLFEKLMTESWNLKKSMTGVITPRLEEIELNLCSIGIKWIKLLGAGGGGSFLCKPKDRSEFISKLNEYGYLYSYVNVSKKGLETWTI